MKDLTERKAVYLDDAIEAINEYFARIGKLKRRGLTIEEKAIKLDTIDAIKALPPVQPERKTGQWIDEGFYADGHGAHAFRCSECGGHIIEYDTDPFCKWCGADMREE